MRNGRPEFVPESSKCLSHEQYWFTLSEKTKFVNERTPSPQPFERMQQIIPTHASKVMEQFSIEHVPQRFN